MLLILTLIVIISNLLLGFTSFVSNRKSATNKIFFILTIILSFWALSNYFSVQNYPLSVVFIWLKVIMILTAAMFPTLFLLSKAFPYEQLTLSKKVLFAIIVFVLTIQILVGLSFVFVSVEIKNGLVAPIPGPALPLFALNVFLFLGLTIYTLYRKFRVSEGKEKSQLKFLIGGISVTFILATITNFVLVNFFNITSLVPSGPLFTIILVASVTYAIVKHELFKIKILAAQILTTVIWVVLFSRIFLARSFSEALVDIFTFAMVVLFGILLVKSVMDEVKQRQKLAELTERLKVLDAQKDTFISMAAHELRAPMTAIKGYVSMVMEGDTGDIPEKARGFLADANNITDRLVRLVNNMLNVSRIEEGRMVYQVEVENLSQAARAVFSQFAPEAQRKGLKYELEIPNEIKDRVKVDPDRIQEVIGNFLSNAIKYTDQGSVILRLSQPDATTVRCEVVDTGPGISKEEQQKLFQKFHRVETNVGKTTGTGLGLYISRLLVEKFNGKIGVDSEAGKGSIFWFELSLAE
ncbi:hypothetical protein A2962_02340 [Candidatus Woesebacteria bacterium RIFCSPLOWO2_01_FULL_39_61]|uniref:histidine kinase n=1 Tax=Candidatus Woesebacteria bacterium RIFCSPHIGHO2_02_FULL_39_13 TaxID=1802505 RepID=A0A1F7Z511_9BACT|nr:MAG: hypothetical protein A2692_01355 [Candidatus Woesebacteria bacterium RIFCSPHIGHO2_01_FULL_39_95]OGM33998.1 MAG: hypothetical protein A3D01_03645 [Candidatus Woesebacteria bacterium RIFCSPHIGHO2_02_FULL_39_13]OGM38256.1 MAG: hypothetical protein A3E13_05755 [Candidatus Woesebacteria bacterium RIFCSPHIGHO2_12_FULL_40_20]OGM66962.1 MAG: hypothetical protein A2962_02340 [Candidatus Woesebacteria bacterium RIFCSPLOWO2_01_FULL_39_61]OGM75506.1 MAG: hypothetical protein A3H19_00570 [Candidatus